MQLLLTTLTILGVMLLGGLSTAVAAALIEFVRAWADPARRADIRRHSFSENVARALR